MAAYNYYYSPSARVAAAKKLRDEYALTRPGFVYSKEDKLKEAEKAYYSPESFRYDPQNDPVYLRYKEQYLKNGRNAYRDALAEGSFATGGYSNSYAEAAANEAYSRYAEKLTGVIPELYKAAYERYGDSVRAAKNALEMLYSDKKNEYALFDSEEKAKKSEYDALNKAYLDEYDRDIKAGKLNSDAALKALSDEKSAENAKKKLELEETKLGLEKDKNASSDGKNGKESGTVTDGGENTKSERKIKTEIKNVVNSGDYEKALEVIARYYASDAEIKRVASEFNVPKYFVTKYLETRKTLSSSASTKRKVYTL